MSMRQLWSLMALMWSTAAIAQTSFSKDVYSTGNCTFKWYCDTSVLAGGPARASATINGHVGQVYFGNTKQVTGTAPITARVETDTPDDQEHLLDCRDEKAYYTYFQEAQIGPSLAAVGGQQPEPVPIMPCACEVAECEACFEGEQPSGDLCDYFPDFCKRAGEAEPSNLIDFCPPDCTSPLLVDLGRDGFTLSGPEGAVAFDLLRAGAALKIQWVVPGGNDAFLVQDLNGNGVVDDGAELFGNGTRLYFDALGLAPNGFVALAQYDDPELGGNDDGYISAADKVWRRLLLWLDANADGLCDPEEMMAVPRTLITHLETLPTEHRQRDANGNRLRYWAQCHVGTAPLTRPFDMVDVFFKQVD